MTYNNTEDKKYKLDEALYGAADAAGNNNAGAASTSAGGTYGTNAAQLGGTALSLGSSKTYRAAYDNPIYLDAMDKLRRAESELPGYKGTYATNLEELYTRITGRDDFTYDINSDPVYQQYRDIYTRNGRLAMMDTMGQAAALTGGYGSTFSQSVGQQQYNAYMQGLNDVVPTLYENAYNRWQNEGAELYNRYNLTQSMANDEYNKYRDQLSDYWQNVSYAQGNADRAYDMAQNDLNWQYQLERDAVSDRQQARENMLESMAVGYVPDYEYAQMVGMAPAELDAWLAYIAEQNKPKYSGGGGGASYSEAAKNSVEYLRKVLLNNSYLNGSNDTTYDYDMDGRAGDSDWSSEVAEKTVINYIQAGIDRGQLNYGVANEIVELINDDPELSRLGIKF